MGYFSSYFLRRLYWADRRRWSQQANAAEREARLAYNYTPRERNATQDHQLDRAYRFSRDALLDALDAGFVDQKGLQAMQAGMATMAPHKERFGVKRYDELRALLDRVERLPVQRTGLLNWLGF